MKMHITLYLTTALILSLHDQGFSQEQLHLQQLQQGLQYRYYYPNIKGHQYFEKPVYLIGNISFEGIRYEDVLLNFDVYNELVLTPVERNGLTENIIVDQARIDWFTLDDHKVFVNIKSDSSSLAAGIYQQLVKKPEATLYVRTEKNVGANVGRPGELLEKFVSKTTYFLMVNDAIFTIKKRKDLEQAFEFRPEIIKYIRASKFKFKNDQQLTNALLMTINQL